VDQRTIFEIMFGEATGFPGNERLRLLRSKLRTRKATWTLFRTRKMQSECMFLAVVLEDRWLKVSCLHGILRIGNVFQLLATDYNNTWDVYDEQTVRSHFGYSAHTKLLLKFLKF